MPNFWNLIIARLSANEEAVIFWPDEISVTLNRRMFTDLFLYRGFSLHVWLKPDTGYCQFCFSRDRDYELFPGKDDWLHCRPRSYQEFHSIATRYVAENKERLAEWSTP